MTFNLCFWPPSVRTAIEKVKKLPFRRKEQSQVIDKVSSLEMDEVVEIEDIERIGYNIVQELNDLGSVVKQVMSGS